MLPIEKIAEKIGIDRDELEFYGKYKAKYPLECIKKHEGDPDGKLVLVTAMNPTPAGEGKTTVSIGLAQALNKKNKKVMLALREPSLGPVFGVKGGAAGGGYSQVVPMEDINLHFTGDLHAITSANNLLSAMLDNHLFQGNELNIDKDRIIWKRCLDMNDRSLRKVTVGVGGGLCGVERNEIFSITAASEVMAILCLSKDMEDLKDRLSKIVVAYNMDGGIVTAGDLNAQGAMATLLKDAISPNLVQSLEHVPAFVHGGPFANISHGCNTVIATKAGLKLSDILITEAGFGADLGAEKFLDIKCRAAGIWPDAVVIVATCRSLKYNAGIPCVVAGNKFLTDTDEEIAMMKKLCEEKGALYEAAEIFAKGGEGGLALADAVLKQIESNKNKTPKYTYELTDSVEEKINKIAKTIYGAKDVNILPEAAEKIKGFVDAGFGNLPICVAKTQYSLSDNAKALGRPEDFTLTVRDVWLSAGAGYLVVLTGAIVTMPGLPPHPLDIDIDPDGTIHGLF